MSTTLLEAPDLDRARLPAAGRPLRILMICKDAEPGGTTSHYVDLAEGLAEAGALVELVVPVRGPDGASLRVRGCAVRRQRSFARAFSTEISPAALWDTMVRRADLVHLQLPNPSGLVGAALRSRTPLVVTYACDLGRRFGMAGGLYLALQRHVLERADRVLVTSPPMLDAADLRGTRARLAVVPMGMRTARMELSAADRGRVAELRASWGDRVVLFVGRLAYYKGLDVLLEAARRLEARFVVVGDGTEATRLREKTRALGLGGRVLFLGHISEAELRSSYHAADVVTLPSTISEAFGLVQVEAALCGRPMVSTRLGTGVEWVTQDGRTGLIVPPGDPAALANALRRLLDDPALAARLGAAARERALREFDARLMVERTLAIYRDVLDAHAERAH